MWTCHWSHSDACIIKLKTWENETKQRFCIHFEYKMVEGMERLRWIWLHLQWLKIVFEESRKKKTRCPKHRFNLNNKRIHIDPITTWIVFIFERNNKIENVKRRWLHSCNKINMDPIQQYVWARHINKKTFQNDKI